MEPDQDVDFGVAGFPSIVGHGPVIARLERAIDSGRVHHAFYFTGPAGVGKAAVGVAFAQALNCSHAPGRGCGQCQVCSRIGRNIHPDLVWIEAEGKQIKIEQVRRLEERLAQGAHEGRALVILVNEVDRMSIGAANALLKSLEEPRAGVHFVLVSAASHRVPITVRSRCQQVRFGPLSVEVVAAALAAETTLGRAEREEVARLSAGSLTHARLLVDSEELRVWQRWVDQLATGQLPPLDIPGQVQELLREVDEPEEVLKLLRVRLRDQLLLAVGADAQGQRLVQVDPEGAEAELARQTPLVVIQRRLAAVQAGLRDLRFYVNKHLALERVFLQLCRP
ncbi:MAG: DNA polymerase III subunit delta' [bacterium]